MRVEVDADFAAWVGARERPFVHAAYLVLGDRRAAEAVVVGVLATIAPRWDRLRRDDPDAEGRRLLFRDAVSRHPHRGDAGPGDPDRVSDDWLDAGPDVARALGSVSARQRALLVLRCLEGRTAREAADTLGTSPGTAESQTDVALRRIREALPWVDGLYAVAVLLDRATGHLPDVDLADRAWEAAALRGGRRRRSLAATTAAVLLAGAILTYATSRGPSHDAVPDRSSQVTSGPVATATSSGVADDGTQLFLGPPPDVIANLPIVGVGVPGQVEWDPRAAPQPLAQIVADHAGSSGRANLRILYAVLSGRAVDRWVPVLLVRDDRDGSLNYAAADATLGPLGTTFGDPGGPLTARAIDPTGTEAMFVQPHAVLVVDVTTGRTRTSTQPADAGATARLVDGGFTDTGRIVVRSADAAWSLDPATLVWTRMASVAAPEAVRIVTAAGESHIVSLTPDGEPGASVPAHLPVAQTWGESVVTGDWVVTGGVVDDALVPPQFRVPNGLFLVSRTDPTVRRAVVLGANAPGGISGGVRTVGVAGRVVLFQYSVAGRTWVLGLDPTTGLVSRVAEVWSPADGVGSANQVIALSPWAISHR